MKITLMLMIMLGMLYGDGELKVESEHYTKEEECCLTKEKNTLNTYKIDILISKVKAVEKQNTKFIESNAVLKSTIVKLKNDDKEQIKIYKDIIQNNHDLYYNQLITFQLILIAIGTILSFLAFFGWREIKNSVVETVTEQMNTESNKAIALMKVKSDEKLVKIDEKVNEKIEKIEKLESAFNIKSAEYENILKDYEEILKNLTDKPYETFSIEDKRKLDLIASELSYKKDKNDNDWFIIGLEHQQNKNYTEAISSYKTATELNPKNSNAFSNWGLALFNLAREDNNIDIYKESIEKSKIATELNPKDENSFMNIAIALFTMGMLNGHDDELYNEGVEKIQKATELNPKNANAFSNWGYAIINLAILNGDEELYKKGIEKLNVAIELEPKHSNAFAHWGLALFHLAKAKEDEALYKESIEKFKLSIELNPNNIIAMSNLGISMAYLSVLNNDKNLNAQAIKQAYKAYELGQGAYNLSCTHAILKNKEEAFKYLKEALEVRRIPITHIEKDGDWNNYKDNQDFIKLLNKYR